MSGCFSPSISDGDFKCATTDPKCPPDFTCASDNKCRKTGMAGDGGLDPDGTMGSFEAILMVTPRIDLNDVVFGTTVATPVRATIRNTGTGNSGNVGLMKLGLDMAAFTIVNDMCSNRVLMPNDSCTFDVANDPMAPQGMKMATIRVSGQPGMTHDIMLTANIKSIITVDPTMNMFPTTAVGMTSASKVFQFMNTGTIRAEMLVVRLVGTDVTDFAIVTGMDFCSGSNLQPGTSCNVTVVFRPQSGGAKAARLELTSKPGGTAVSTISGST